MLNITCCSILIYWENGKLHTQKFQAREDSSNCDWQTTNLLQFRCQLHKNTVTAESHSDLSIAKTKNVSRFLL